KLWGQPYVPSIFAMLLHQWLLNNNFAGGQQPRQTLMNVMISGARQLFWGDVHSTRTHFRSLYAYLSKDVALNSDTGRLDSLPAPSRAALLSVVAAFLPYYAQPQELLKSIQDLPVPSSNPEPGRSHVKGEGADFLLAEAADTLKAMQAEGSLIRYLVALGSLQSSPYFANAYQSTRLRLQVELYSLTWRGGPRYVPPSVNQAALRTLNALFPLGKRSRRLVSLAFRLWWRPTEWSKPVLLSINSAWHSVVRWLSGCLTSTWAAMRRLIPRWRRRVHQQ
ncbi:hypothetical protein WJX84_009968, partial [Apatococcus fuscideae]